MKTQEVLIEITPELISAHRRDVGNPTDCPGFHALVGAGVDVKAVFYEGVEGHDGEVVEIPDAFAEWQRNACERQREPRPIAFSLRVPNSWVVAGATR